MRIPFVVALNKIDRMYDWNPIKDASIHQTIINKKHMLKS